MKHAKRLEKAKRELAKPDYVQKDGVHCKVCARKIVGLVEVGEIQEDVIHGKYKQMVMMDLPGYVNVEIEMENEEGKQSLHGTPLCKPCSGKLSQEDLENIFAIDIDQMEKEAPVKDYVKKRKPIKVVDVKET